MSSVAVLYGYSLELECPPVAELPVVAGRGRGFTGRPPKAGRMEDDHNDNPYRDSDLFFLTVEESALAERLGELLHADFARILNQLSPSAKDELRAAIGFLDAKYSFPPEEQ